MCCPRPAESGYVLLLVMWLLVLGGAVAAATLAVALAGARAANALEDDLRRDLAVRAAVDQIVHDLARDGDASVWLAGPRGIGGPEQLLTARVTAEAARLDLRAAPPAQVAALLAARPGGAALRDWLGRSAPGAAGLAPIARLAVASDDPCLLDAVTLYSGRPVPAATAGIGLDDSLAPAETGARGAIIGEAVRIELAEPAAASPGAPARRLVAIVRLTGSAVTPFWIHDWFWTAGSRCAIRESGQSKGAGEGQG